MSANHGRRLASLGRRSARPAVDALTANVETMNLGKEREKPAAIVLAAYAQALAGTALQPADEAPGEPEPAPVEQTSPAPDERRADQHTEVPLEKAWGQPYLDHTTAQPEPPPLPRDYDDPWGQMIPSYARAAKKEDPEEQ